MHYIGFNFLNILNCQIINQNIQTFRFEERQCFRKERMKKLINPTTYFFQNAQNQPNHHSKQIEQFVGKLINFQKCLLCKNLYDLVVNKPRIMIHCGHTFCTPCLLRFYKNRRVRCPMCLKLVKQIDSIDRIPLNHSIVRRLVQKQNKDLQRQQQQIKKESDALNIPNRQNNKKNLKIQDADKFLYSQFQRTQKQALLRENPPKIDPVSNLPFCVFHTDRVQHFYCAYHNAYGCRTCMQVGHSKSECQSIDLYNDNDPRVTQLLHSKQAQHHQQASYQKNYGIMDLQPIQVIRKGKPNFLKNLGVLQQKITPRMQEYHEADDQQFDQKQANFDGQEHSQSVFQKVLDSKDFYSIKGLHKLMISQSSELSSEYKNSEFEDQYEVPQFGTKTHSEYIYGYGLEPKIDLPPLKIQKEILNPDQNKEAT